MNQPLIQIRRMRITHHFQPRWPKKAITRQLLAHADMSTMASTRREIGLLLIMTYDLIMLIILQCNLLSYVTYWGEVIKNLLFLRKGKRNPWPTLSGDVF